MKSVLLWIAAVTLSACAGSGRAPEAPAPPSANTKDQLRIGLTGVLVEDQDRARSFYTEKLGFEVKHDIPLGEFHWLTVVSPAGPEGCELLLEPNAHPAALAFQQAMYADGIPATLLFVDDVQAAYDKLCGRGVVFRTPPTDAGTVKIAVFEDTCGNLIQITDG